MQRAAQTAHHREREKVKNVENDRALVAFEKYKIRRFYDEQNETWYFSVIDVVGALTDSVNPRDYCLGMKIRVKTEDGFELSTICRRLKLMASDGKRYGQVRCLTQAFAVAAQTLLRPRHLRQQR
jgi:hypothetical protein